MAILTVSVSGNKTEHAGPKKGRGAYYGRKKRAKNLSAKRRRGEDAAAARDTNPKSGNEPMGEDR